MSWIANIEGKPDPNFKDDGPKVADPAIPDRMVSTKRANQPFLAYKAYRDEQARLHDAWREREEARLAAIARGDPNPPRAERDPTASKEIGLLGLLKFFLVLTLVFLSAGKFVTGEWMWGLEGEGSGGFGGGLFSERLLAEFDGTVEGNPIYIAINGDVYDVSSNRRIYGPGGSYALMTGVDAARAFGTGCFKDHRTHDLRGLSESEIQSVEHWKKFFSEHKSYFKVGRVNHPPIDPMSPLPVHCDPKKEAAQKARWGASATPRPTTESEFESESVQREKDKEDKKVGERKKPEEGEGEERIAAAEAAGRVHEEL
ncbi:cytochrome b5-like heme/steroid binding domain-containing protein [Multifurca ochricompacta]|uniref:Cytochrome b5-like heme/steroid binding domain-containing protein n=1 Tax=Multifurca ochricompacta TaxID=376703 RepID=A0AAD4M1E0_9AGAM|nr:cytochrome b5-like heme/steroid binding domain-containing protein [Multifurca ochricompacta]